MRCGHEMARRPSPQEPTRRNVRGAAPGALTAWLLAVALAASAWAADKASGDYRLRPGDVVSITVWDFPEHTVPRVEVRPDGKIVHPFAGEVVAEGRTTSELSAELRRLLMREIKNPVVTVTVVEFREDRIFVGGAVQRPGPVPIREPLTVQQALAAAGGATKTADLTRALLVHPDGHQEQVDLAAELEAEGGKSSILLSAGCTLVLYERAPQSVAVLGSVAKPGIYEFPNYAKLADAIALAGGLTKDADPKAARFTRPGTETITVDLERVLDNPQDPANVLLQPGDAVLVTAKEPALVAVLGAVLKPGIYEIPQNGRVGNALALAGGPSPDAELQQARLTRSGQPAITVNLRNILDDVNAPDNLALQAGDALYVPGREPAMVAVLGAVTKPGVYELPPGARLSSALALAGGLLKDADAHAARLTRIGAETVTVDLQAIMDRVDDPANVVLRDGDALFVPTREPPMVAVIGQVVSPGVKPLNPGATVSDAVALAGGLTRTADDRAAKLLRADGSVLTLDLGAILSGKEPGADLTLANGDTLFVPELQLPRVAVLGAVKAPGQYTVQIGGRFSDALAQAGGLADPTDRGAAAIIHPDGSTTDVSLRRILDDRDPAANLELRDGDTIVIQSLTQGQVAVLGEVSAPGRFTLGRVRRLADLLAVAGLTPASDRNAQLLRADGSTVQVNIDEVLSGQDSQANLQLQDGDTLVVGSAERNVAVLGAVNRPGRYSLRRGDRFSDAIAAAGDLTPLADRKQAKMLRLSGEMIVVDPTEATAGHDQAANPLLEDGDTIIIDVARIQVAVLGEVARPGHYELRPDSRFSDAIAQAGGMAPLARARHATVMRLDGTAETVDLELVLRRSDPAANISLRDGDTIVVQAGPPQEVSVLGRVNKPQKVRWEEGERVSDAIVKAEGLAPGADEERATIMRADGTVVEVDLEGVLRRRDPAANLLLQPGDTLVIGAALQGSAGVVGAVTQPGLLPIGRNERITDLLARSGGPTPTADLQHCTLRRADGTRIELDLAKLLNDVESEANIRVEHGDTLYVPSVNIGQVAVLGAVAMPGRYPVGRAERVSAVIARAGGLKASVGVSDALLMRSDGTSLKINVQEALAKPGSPADPPVADGDTLVVNEVAPITVLGAVFQPGVFYVPPGSRASAAVAQAKGATATANLEKATVMRRDGTSVQVNLSKVLREGDQAADVELQPGDVLIIPSAEYYVSVIGAVKQAGRYRFAPGARITDALALAGGLTDKADLQRCTVMRGTEKHEVDLSRVMRERDSEANFSLQDGDTLIVDEIRPVMVSVLGKVTKEGRYDVSGGPRLSEAIAAAGGLAPGADPQRVTVNQGGKSRTVDLSPLLRGQELSEDVALSDGDLVIVPETSHVVTVLGVVKSPGVIQFEPGERVLDVVGKAGGWIPGQAAPNRTIITRKTEDGLAATTLNLAAATGGGDEKMNPLVQDGDLIYVPDRSQRTLDTVLKTLFPLATIMRYFVD